MATHRAALWRNRDYLLLWGGQALSVLGSSLQDITLPLLILALTGSPAQAGIAGALGALPFPLLSLPAGALIDRWDRKRVMLLCDGGRAVAAGSIPLALWTGHLTMAHIDLVALSGIFATFFSLAETAALPHVVAKDQIPAAMGQNYATAGTTSILGPPLGGFLYGLGHTLPFLFNAASFAASVLSLRCIRADFQRSRRSTTPRHLRAEIREGLAWAWRHPLLRFLALRNGAANIAYAGSPLILIVVARHQHAPPVAIGAIFALDALGGLVGALLVGRIQRRVRFGHMTLGLAWLTAALFPLYALAPNPIALGLISAVLSVALVVFDLTQLGYRAAIIPDEVMGRVTSSIRLLTVGGLALGPALVGALLQTIGATSTIVAVAGYLLILALATTANAQVRSARTIGDVAAGW